MASLFSHRVGTVAAGVIAGLALSSLGLTVAVPAAYADTLTDDLRSYQLRVPSSVIDDTTLTPDEKTAFRDLTRNNGRPLTVPMGGGSNYSRPGGGKGVSGLLGVLISFGGDQGWFEVKPDPELDAARDARIEATRAEQCATLAKSQSGNADWFMPSWLAESNEWLYGLLGSAPCSDELEVDTAYEPISTPSSGNPAGVTSYPVSIQSSNGGGNYSALEPYWSSARTNIDGKDASGRNLIVNRQEGWVVPIRVAVSASSTAFLGYVVDIYPDGSVSSFSGYSGTNGAATNGDYSKMLTQNPSSACASGEYQCVVVSKLQRWDMKRADLPQSFYIGGFNASAGYRTLPNLPFADVAVGSAPGVYDPSVQYPLQEFVTTVTDTQGNVYSCTSKTFREAESFVPKPCSPEVPTWAIPEREEVTQGAPGALPAEVVPIRQTETSPEYREWRTTYPGCDVETCLLDLSLTDGRSCFDTAELCDGWYTDPNKGTKYGCTYHGVAVVLAKCAAYERTFNKEARDSGEAYPDVAGATPGAGSSSTPGSAVEPFADATPEARGDCFPRGWNAFNPLEWVLKPVGCALHVAFVPRESVVKAGNERLLAAVTGSALGGMSAVLAVLGDSVVEGGGCSGIPWHFEVYTLVVDTALLDSCPGSELHDTAVIIRGILAASLSTIAVLSWVRYIGMIFGYGSFSRGSPESVHMESVSEINIGRLRPDIGELDSMHRREIER